MFRTSLAVSLLGVLCLLSLGRCAVAEEGRRTYRLTIEVTVPVDGPGTLDHPAQINLLGPAHPIAEYLRGYFASKRFRTFMIFTFGEYSREKVELSHATRWDHFPHVEEPAEADRPVKSH
jgi:hypothetical protein